MSWPRPPKLIRNSTPTMLISAKIRPSRRPTKIVGSAAGKDLPELLRRRELEAAADVDQHAARAGEPLDGLQDHGRQAGDEADHDDGRRAAAEDHQEQRIHQHGRRGGQRGDPGLGRARAAGARDTAARRARRRRPRAAGVAQSASRAVGQKRCGMCSSTMMRWNAPAICEGSGTMKRLITPTRIRSFDDQRSRRDQRADAERERQRRCAARARSSPALSAHARLVLAHAAARFLAQVVPDLRDVAAERLARHDLGRARARQVDRTMRFSRPGR